MGRAKAFADLGEEEKGKASVNLEKWPGGFLAAETPTPPLVTPSFYTDTAGWEEFTAVAQMALETQQVSPGEGPQE